jgi:lipopolysaccharide export system permease protein
VKKIDRLILRSFIGPLLLTFSLSVLVLLMQFVWKYVDDLVGKGLEFSVIAELLLYASATFVPMALPIAVLFASIMTMGNFGEKYELVAMKAGGISVRRAMMPMALVVLLLTGVAFYFANNVMPTAMLKYRVTLYDITRKKPAINIRPGEYYKELEGYVIRVGGKDRNGHELSDVVIYDHTKGSSQMNVIVAQRGNMQASSDNRFLRFTLYDGYSYSELSDGKNFLRRPFTTVGFREQSINIDISSFAFNRTVEGEFKGSYQMMNIYQLDTSVARLDSLLNEKYHTYRQSMVVSLHAWQQYAEGEKRSGRTDAHVGSAQKSTEFSPDSFLQRLNPGDRSRALNHARNLAQGAANEAQMYADTFDGEREYINRHHIEWHRKFTLSVACLLLFLIGAPFGSIVRKGGLGLPLVASVGFFVLYYVVGMIAEKAVRESALGPEGMWISSLVMLPIGIVLTLQATTDSSFFDGSSWRKFFGKASQKFKLIFRRNKVQNR